MMTVITETVIQEGQEPAWDSVFRERAEDAAQQDGWIALQLLMPLEAPNTRVVVGTWRSRADWEAWHLTDVFQRTRDALDAIQQEAKPERWFEVLPLDDWSAR